MDRAALIFARTFYKLIFRGLLICDAFNQAKAAVEFEVNLGQSNMFKILLQEEVKVIKSLGSEKEDPHRCFIFGPLLPGRVMNLTEKTNIKYFPTNLNELRGRRKELFDLVMKIQEGERLI